jgi:alpha-ribazole phosphatase
MHLTLIRHTEPNIEKNICYGQSDIDLKIGWKKIAKSINMQLANMKFDKFYSSPLKRCKKLAIAIDLKLNIEYTDLLKEINFGDWELKSWDQIYADPYSKKWFGDYINTKTPNGESNIELVERVGIFIQNLKKNNFENVLIITHAGVIRTFYTIINKLSISESFDKKINYGEIIEFTI